MWTFALDGAFKAFFLVCARVVPAVVLLPFFGGASLPWVLRLGFGAALAGWLCAAMSPQAFVRASSGVWGLLLIKELAIGFVLAWLASLAFKAAEVAGHIADVARRADGPTLVDPLDPTNTNATPLAVLYSLFAVLVFCALGGPGHFVSALGRSYDVLPLGQAAAGMQGPALIAVVARAVSGMLESAVAMAAPVLMAVWLSELVVAVAARVSGSGGTDLSSLVRASSPLLGLAAVLLSLGVVRAALEGTLSRVPALVLHTLASWAKGA